MGKILAFSGKATSGKTTAARRLGGMFGSNKYWAIESFATPLKNIVQEHFSLYGLEPGDLIHNKNKVLQIGDRQMTVRQLMIDVGKMYRAIDKDYWARRLMQRIDTQFDHGCTLAMVDDLRYANEYDLLRSRGAIIVRIERPGIPLIDDVSETDLDGHAFDHVLRNDGAVDDLFAKLDGLAHGLRLQELL